QKRAFVESLVCDGAVSQSRTELQSLSFGSGERSRDQTRLPGLDLPADREIETIAGNRPAERPSSALGKEPTDIGGERESPADLSQGGHVAGERNRRLCPRSSEYRVACEAADRLSREGCTSLKRKRPIVRRIRALTLRNEARYGVRPSDIDG